MFMEKNHNDSIYHINYLEMFFWIILGILVSLVILVIFLIYRKYQENFEEKPDVPKPADSPSDKYIRQGKPQRMNLGALNDDSPIPNTVGNTTEGLIFDNDIPVVIGENNLLPSDNPHHLNDQKVGMMKTEIVNPKAFREEYTKECKQTVMQNDNLSNPIRKHQNFTKFEKKAPMKTYGNIKLLGYHPGPKELHEYYCGKSRFYAKT
jgi:hypothetical protein